MEGAALKQVFQRWAGKIASNITTTNAPNSYEGLKSSGRLRGSLCYFEMSRRPLDDLPATLLNGCACFREDVAAFG